MIFNGTQCAATLAKNLAQDVSLCEKKPVLGVCMVGDNAVSKRYVALKKRTADVVGIEVRISEFPESITTEELIQELGTLVRDCDGFIVQLPLPAHIDTKAVLNAIPKEKDVDMLSEEAMDAYYQNTASLLPPVIGVFAEILSQESIDVASKKVVIVGYGRLVGKPAEHWFKKEGADVHVVREGDDIRESTIAADIVVLGTGVPEILTADMVRDGVVILDAGTSEAQGALKGDAHPDVADKALLFTPVPGGIGPVTVVMLLKNLVSLCAHV